MKTVSLTSEFDYSGSAVPEWVKILPLNEFGAHDGRKFKVSEPQNIVNQLLRENVELPFDYEHATQAEDHSPKPAAGWIKALETRADGIWAKVDWTTKAKEMIKNKEYRYLSPVLSCTLDDSGIHSVIAVKSVALTNNPALKMTAFCSNQETVTLQNQQVLNEIACLINTESSEPSEILAALKKQQQTQEATLCKNDVNEVISTLVFPRSCEDELLTVRQSIGQEKFKSLMQNLSCSGFGNIQILKTQTAALKARGINLDDKPNNYGLSEQELAVCKETNIKPEDYIKVKESNNGH